jgi:hypothetical protein
MDDPAAVLRAQLDEDEQVALAVPVAKGCVPPAHWAAGSDPGGDPRWVLGTFVDIDAHTPAAAAHIVRHHPARTLRNVAAMRKVLDAWPNPFGNWTADQADAARAMKAQILELLAEPYREQT